MFSKLPALMKLCLRPTHGYQDTQGRMPGVTLPFPHQWYVMQLIQHDYIVNVSVRGITRNRRTWRVSRLILLYVTSRSYLRCVVCILLNTIMLLTVFNSTISRHKYNFVFLSEKNP